MSVLVWPDKPPDSYVVGAYSVYPLYSSTLCDNGSIREGAPSRLPVYALCILLSASVVYHLLRYTGTLMLAHLLQLCEDVPIPSRRSLKARSSATINVFIKGVGPKGVVLHVPVDATGDWIVRALERRRLVPRTSASSRLSYELQVYLPGSGAAASLVLSDAVAAQDGISNNATLWVKYKVLGGARTNYNKIGCPGCPRTFSRPEDRDRHAALATIPACRPSFRAQHRAPDIYAGAKRVSFQANQVGRFEQNATAGPSRLGPLDIGLNASSTGDVDMGDATDALDADAGQSTSDGDGDGYGHDAIIDMDLDRDKQDEDGDHPLDRMFGALDDERMAAAQEAMEAEAEVVAEEAVEEHVAVDVHQQRVLGDEDSSVEGARDHASQPAEADDDEVAGHREEQDADEDAAHAALDIDGDVVDIPLDDEAYFNLPPAPNEHVDPNMSSDDDSSSSSDDEELPPQAPAPARTPTPAPARTPTPAPARPPTPAPARPPTPLRPPPKSNYHTEKYRGEAGKILNSDETPQHRYSLYASKLPDGRVDNNPYHPFASKMDWQLAYWAKTRGVGATAFTELLQIPGLANKIDVTYRNSRELNMFVDALPDRPMFKRRTYRLGGETHDMYFRDVLDIIRVLYESPEFAKDMVYAPVKRYFVVKVGRRRLRVRRYSDMHTAQWWWQLQDQLEADKPGATIVPLIISSDKTQLTLFRNRAAYPVYLTIGNIPKEIRRKPSRQAQLLVGYLPVAKLDGIKNDDSRRRALANLFHRCMRDLLRPLEKAGTEGVVMTSGDGLSRRCHPIFAAFVGDYPEQVLVTGVKSGQCSQGTLPADQRGDNVTCRPRSHKRAVEALEYRHTNPGDPEGFLQRCEAAGVKPLQQAFWTGLPYVDVYQTITPDILHQLYQGVLKHVIGWVKDAYGKEVVDARIQRLPPNHQLRHFTHGISGLSRVSGAEHQDICRIILGAIADVRLPGGNDKRIQRSLRGILDFAHLAQYSEHTAETLNELDAALDAFHADKQVFIDLGIREHFNFPKMHALQHYAPSVRLMGTADNYNTSYSERLHIDFAKSAYRSTNRKDEYPQMTLWLLRKEKMHVHRRYIDWRDNKEPATKDMPRPVGPRELKYKRTITRYPSVKSVSFKTAEETYGAEDFEKVLRGYIATHNLPPDATRRDIEEDVAVRRLPFKSVRAYHKLKFWHPDALQRESDLAQEESDCVHARPGYRDTQSRRVYNRFDTALVNEYGEGRHTGVQGYRVGRVRLIFDLTERAMQATFTRPQSATHFAYVEWYDRIPAHERDDHRFYQIKKVRGEVLSSIVDVRDISRSIHLVPKFGRDLVTSWTTDSVLDNCDEFYINGFSDKHAYFTLR